MQADTWPRNECEDQSTQEDSFARDEHASIVPAMSQSVAKDTWTRDDADNEPIVQPDPANSRLATALLLNVPRPAKTICVAKMD